MADRRVVQTAGLCKTFRDFWRRPRVEAVKDLNLEVHAGEVFGLLGPNGSGKTTTIKLLLGLLYPTKGRISLFGRSPTDVEVKARIGFLPEESYLYRFLVAHETLDYFGRLFRLPARVRKERTEKLLDMVGLTHEAKRPVGEYSKGMARRIGLAQALINDPEFLILDEPTSGLDPIGARQIKDVIRELGRKGKTILLSSHILADVEDVCDRVVILYGGQQHAAGTIDELLAQRDRTQITLPAVSDETVAKIKSLVTKSLVTTGDGDATPFEVTHPRQTLESFFLQKVEEAQAQNIRTYGARASGAMPEFLQKPTEVSTEEVVDSLVQAAAHPSPTQRLVSTAPPAEQRLEEPSQEVIGALLEGAAAPADEPVPAGELRSVLAAEDEPTSGRRREPPEADANVIDALVQHSDATEAPDVPEAPDVRQAPDVPPAPDADEVQR